MIEVGMKLQDAIGRYLDDALKSYACCGDKKGLAEIGCIMDETCTDSYMNTIRFLMLEMAEDYDAEVLFHQGLSYYSGWGVVKNEEEGLWKIRCAAEEGSDDAVLFLGVYYYEHNEMTKAIELIEKSMTAEPDCIVEDMYVLLGDAYSSLAKPDVGNAIKYYTEAINQYHNAYSCRKVGLIYMDGLDGKANEEKALYYLEKAVELGDVESAIILAEKYMFPKKTEEKINYRLAAQYLKKVEDSDDSNIPYYLGIIYNEGDSDSGIERDFDKAEMYFKKSLAIAPVSKALSFLGYLYYLDEKYTDAYKLLIQAEENDVNVQQALLGVMYYKGQGCEKNLEKAYYYLKKTYEEKNISVSGCLCLGEMYIHGYGCAQNYNEAYQVYEYLCNEFYLEAVAVMRMAELVITGKVHEKISVEEALIRLRQVAKYKSEAYITLGKYYFDKSDFRKAESCFLDAWKENLSEAGVCLARLYEHGGGTIQKDENKAYQWYCKAADLGNAEAEQEKQQFKKGIFGGYRRIGRKWL